MVELPDFTPAEEQEDRRQDTIGRVDGERLMMAPFCVASRKTCCRS